jgi:hypothetical protein
VPHFSTFGKNYERRFKDTDLFEQIFYRILKTATEKKLISAEHVFVDSTHVKASANKRQFEKKVVRKETRAYQERLECHLYGQLISILLCSSTMFHMRQLLLEKKKLELSEFKAIYMIKDYFPLLFEAMSSGTNELIKILHHLYQLLKKNGRKCHRYKKMKVFDILGVVYETTVRQKQDA